MSGEHRLGKYVDCIFLNPELALADREPEPSVLAFDIEAEPNAARIPAVGMAFQEPRASILPIDYYSDL